MMAMTRTAAAVSLAAASIGLGAVSAGATPTGAPSGTGTAFCDRSTSGTANPSVSMTIPTRLKAGGQYQYRATYTDGTSSPWQWGPADEAGNLGNVYAPLIESTSVGTDKRPVTADVAHDGQIETYTIASTPSCAPIVAFPTNWKEKNVAGSNNDVITLDDSRFILDDQESGWKNGKRVYYLRAKDDEQAWMSRNGTVSSTWEIHAVDHGDGRAPTIDAIIPTDHTDPG